MNSLSKALDERAAQIENKVIGWRRDFHEYPELSHQEERTSGIVADHLLSLGIPIKRGKDHFGVVGILEGGKPGPVIALRADMDALPVTEKTGLPFASTRKALHEGKEVGVMHACGHDAHTSILMGVAETLSGLKDQIQGTVKFIFQPAEECASEGNSGARIMIKDGVLDEPRPEAIFGLHVTPDELGMLSYRGGPVLASANNLIINVKGKQTHAAYPWKGIDPILVASQIVIALQAIVSRQIDITAGAAVVTIATIEGGVRQNIIPDEIKMTGTIRTFDENVRKELCERIKTTAEHIAASWGAHAEVIISQGCPVTFNDPALTQRMLATLERMTNRICLAPTYTGSEDFSFYQQHVPGMFYFLGTRCPDIAPKDAAPNHSPYFMIDESALLLGVRSLAHLAIDFLESSLKLK